jgi:drug/metabolite transporter (DMT)-like permease
MKETTKAHLALLGANLFYGAGFSIAKMIMPLLMEPRGFILIRVGCASILFWISYFFGQNFRAKIEKKDWLRLIVCAIFGVAINQLLFFTGLNLTSPIHASLLMLATPILVSVIAAFYLSEKWTSKKIIGLLLALTGAILLISTRANEKNGSNILLGDICIFLNACAYAAYLVLVKPLMQKYRPIIVIRWVFLIGFIVVVPFGFRQVQAVQWHLFQSFHWQALAFVIIGITFFTFLWNIYALKILPAGVAGAYIYLQPIFAAIIAALFFQETITLHKIVSAILIFLGVILSTNSWQRKQGNKL